MPDEPKDTPDTGGNDSGATPAADGAFTPITSQEELNAALKDRLARERAKFGDYNDLKAKAAKFDELEQANKSEVEKANERAVQAEKERDEARVEALRFKVATKFGVSDEDAELFLTGSDEDTLTRQAERLAARNEDAGKPRPPKPDPSQGRSNNGSVSTADQFAAAISGALNH